MTAHDPNPLKELLLDEGATLFPYGVEPGEPGAVRRIKAEGDAGTPLLAAAFGAIELEYASLRTDCVIMDRPDRAVVEVSGADAIDFLGRMLTQDVASLKPGESCSSFWLNRKGRIDADLRVLRLDDAGKGPRLFLELDRGSLDHTIKTLGAYIITEDVTLAARHDLHRVSLHGPTARDLLLVASESYATVLGLRAGANVRDAMPDGVGCWIDQRDTAGVAGYELFIPGGAACVVYERLLRLGRPEFLRDHGPAADPGARGASLAASNAVGPAVSGTVPGRPSADAIRVRPCGWFAYNVARIEAGTALFRVDFGPESLPAETGVIDDRINFKKGCYLGQEIVARMHARGHPKQRLVALRFEDDLPAGADGLPPLPVQGDAVVSMDEPGKPLGSITSSTFSPMLGRVPIALAMVAWSHVEPGTRVQVEADGRRIVGMVQGSLRFLP